MVVAANKLLFVWDLSYVSKSYCTLIASGGVGYQKAELRFVL